MPIYNNSYQPSESEGEEDPCNTEPPLWFDKNGPHLIPNYDVEGKTFGQYYREGKADLVLTSCL